MPSRLIPVAGGGYKGGYGVVSKIIRISPLAHNSATQLTVAGRTVERSEGQASSDAVSNGGVGAATAKVPGVGRLLEA